MKEAALLIAGPLDDWQHSKLIDMRLNKRPLFWRYMWAQGWSPICRLRNYLDD